MRLKEEKIERKERREGEERKERKKEEKKTFLPKHGKVVLQVRSSNAF